MNCLDLTLYPSLTLALLDENYVKRFGARKGVYAGDDQYLSGRWYNPWRYINDADGDVRDKAQELVEKLGDCVSISISPGDEHLIFITAFLTQNTSYHGNVLKWTKALFSKTEDPRGIAEEAPRVGNSYQLRRLPAAVEEYLSLNSPRDRSVLLRIKGVGPKVADLFLLFTGDTTSAPVDKHYMRVAPRLGLRGRAPEPSYCRKYACHECPLARSCLRWLSYSKLGRLAGWVQTVSYLLDKGVVNA